MVRPIFKCTGYLKLLSPGKGLLIDRVWLFRTFREREKKDNSEQYLLSGGLRWAVVFIFREIESNGRKKMYPNNCNTRAFCGEA